MKLSDLTTRAGEWLRGIGPMSEIVISSRMRLARNLAGYRFLTKMSRHQRQQVEGRVRETILSSNISPQTLYVDHLISKQHAASEGARGVAIGDGESVSIMVNEEDHLRIQVLRSGLQLEEAWEQINGIDDALEGKLDSRSTRASAT
jgi:protein arginine kinase